MQATCLHLISAETDQVGLKNAWQRMLWLVNQPEEPRAIGRLTSVAAAAAELSHMGSATSRPRRPVSAVQCMLAFRLTIFVSRFVEQEEYVCTLHNAYNNIE